MLCLQSSDLLSVFVCIYFVVGRPFSCSMTDEMRRRVVEPEEGSDAPFGTVMDSDGMGEGVDDFVLMQRERSSSTSSIESVDSALSQLIPACVWKVVPFESLPSWLKDNEYLRHGYRPPMQSFSKCFGSMFRMHTETWNIWTHLFGMAMFCVIAFCVYVFGMSKISLLPWYEQLIIGAFFLGAILCLGFSFLFHTVSNHSEDVAHLFGRLDYSGITALITGSCIPCYYYSFYCASFSRYLHIIILILLCFLCLSICLLKKFATPEFRVMRAVLFISFGFYSFIPGVQIILQDGFAYADAAYSLSGLLQMASVYVSGAGLYAARIPERFFPGKFDIWASSHQLFHICVLIAAYLHYDSILNMVSHRLSIGLDNCMSPVVL